MEFRLRPAALSDYGRLFAWRNDPVTVAGCLTPQRVKLKDHMEWLRKTLDRKTVQLYVALDSRGPVGTGRIDYDAKKQTAELSLTIDPRRRGQGLASALISQLLQHARNEQAAHVLARVKEENDASLRAFAGCGFWPKAYESEGVVLLEYRQ